MVLPETFTHYTQMLLGEELFESFLNSFKQDPPTSIRVNRAKWSEGPAQAERVPWCSDGYYLRERPNFTFDPLLHAGCYYVQEASSMFVCQALKQHIIDQAPLTVLDLCAAPGGKSTAALSILPEGSILVSNEPIRARAQILAENIHKWGLPHTIVTNNYPADYASLPLSFDVIICDVPCSGEGMFRKDEGAIEQWSAQNVEKCRQLQRNIVDTIWPLLKPGGIMIYSTCTFNTHENEENVAWICTQHEAHLLPIDTEPEWNITGSLLRGYDKPVYRFLPGRTKGEGIFMAVLKKGKDDAMAHKDGYKDRKKKKALRKDGKAALPDCKDWLSCADDLSIVVDKDVISALPCTMMPLYDKMKERLRIMKAGITLGQVKGKDVIPSQSLALSTRLNPAAFATVELSYEQAIAYLRKETVTLPEGTPKGYVAVTFRQKPLGFVKNIGNRTNNLYPAEWKIKSQHVPQEGRIL